MRPTSFVICLALFLMPLAHAEEKAAPSAVPEPPELPGQVVSGEAMEPDITIIRKGEQVIEEYRVNGTLYMVKITPDVGAPYYIVDTDGDGNLETRRSDLDKGTKVPQWLLHSW